MDGKHRIAEGEGAVHWPAGQVHPDLAQEPCGARCARGCWATLGTRKPIRSPPASCAHISFVGLDFILPASCSRLSAFVVPRCQWYGRIQCRRVQEQTVREDFMQFSSWVSAVFALLMVFATQDAAYAQEVENLKIDLTPVDIGPTGIDIKRPVFAGACKGCPWGVLALITQAAMKPSGYDVQICFICWSNFGPREMADKTKPIIPPGAEELPYVEAPPNAVPDISATSEINLVDAWNGTGAYARDNKQRRNYRVIAALQQPNFLMLAASKKSGVTELSQVKNRTSGGSQVLRDHGGGPESAWRRLYPDPKS